MCDLSNHQWRRDTFVHFLVISEGMPLCMCACVSVHMCVPVCGSVCVCVSVWRWEECCVLNIHSAIHYCLLSTAKNLGKWVEHFIQNMEEVSEYL